MRDRERKREKEREREREKEKEQGTTSIFDVVATDFAASPDSTKRLYALGDWALPAFLNCTCAAASIAIDYVSIVAFLARCVFPASALCRTY